MNDGSALQKAYHPDPPSQDPIMNALYKSLDDDVRNGLGLGKIALSSSVLGLNAYAEYVGTTMTSRIYYSEYWRAPTHSISSLSNPKHLYRYSSLLKRAAPPVQAIITINDVSSYTQGSISGVRLVYRTGVGVVSTAAGFFGFGYTGVGVSVVGPIVSTTEESINNASNFWNKLKTMYYKTESYIKRGAILK